MRAKSKASRGGILVSHFSTHEFYGCARHLNVRYSQYFHYCGKPSTPLLAICQVDRNSLEKDLSSQWKAFLRPLFKSTDDPRNFPQVPAVITLIRRVGGNLASPKSQSDELKELTRLCAGSVSVLHHLSLCRDLKLRSQRTLMVLSWTGELRPI